MATAADTVKKTADAATAAAKENVEKTVAAAEKATAAGTQAIREGLDKSIAGLTELNAQSKQNLDAVVASAAAAQKGVEALSNQAVAFSKKSWEDGVAAAQKLSTARSVQELFELQTNWAKSASEAYLAEVNKATETLTASVKDSFAPINARVTAAVETLQAKR
ncbi:MAG: TIGR01841 family phasin [Brevundimonas sp.]|nr:MAG: TIGR01841 family phasin [Brevundimonas sp.]